MTTARRRVAVTIIGATTMATVLAACGGSLVEPEDFVNSGVYAGAQPGQQGGAQVPDGAVGDPTGEPVAPGTGPGSSDPVAAPGTAGGSGSGPGSGSGSGAVGPRAPGNGATSASCAGFRNGPGITDKLVTIASIADISGPVADVFKSVHDAMNAYVAYFNSTSSICGRKLKLLVYDSGLSATGSNDASKSACGAAFALVGSLSAFDSGGANVTEACGQPDVRATATEPARQKARTTFMVVPIDSAHFGIQPWAWIKQKIGRDIASSAFVYLNAGASVTISKEIIRQTAAKLGFGWKETIVVDIAGIPNWNAYANQLKSAGIKFVSSNLADFSPKLASAFKQADFHPVYLADNSAYGDKYVAGQNGDAMDGAYSYTQTAMIEEADRVPEMALYRSWLARTGGSAPAYAGAEAWAAGALFTKAVLELGGKLTRASLIAKLGTINLWDGNGIITPADPSQGASARCATMMQVVNGRFVRRSPFPYTCGPLG